MNKPDYTETYVSKSGKVYTKETYSSGAAAWSIVKDVFGREIPTCGAGGYMPWEERR
jgi:hypothetical protein